METPKRGEVWTVDLGLAAKTRPTLVLSGSYGDKDRAIITVVPHTTAIRDSQYEVNVDTRFLAKPGAFLVQGITSVPAAQAKRKLGTLTSTQVAQVESAVRSWLEL